MQAGPQGKDQGGQWTAPAVSCSRLCPIVAVQDSGLPEEANNANYNANQQIELSRESRKIKSPKRQKSIMKNEIG